MFATCRWSVKSPRALLFPWESFSICSTPYRRLKMLEGQEIKKWDANSASPLLYSVSCPFLAYLWGSGLTYFNLQTIMYWSSLQMRKWDANGYIWPSSASVGSLHQGRVFTSAPNGFMEGVPKKTRSPRLKPMPQQDVYDEWHFPRRVYRHPLCPFLSLHAIPSWKGQ